MAGPSVFDVADFFLRQVDSEAGSVMTHLKLQKLVYYAQAWHLVWHGRPLLAERFEAWIHGPVCRNLWDRYREYEFKPLPVPTEKRDLASVFTTDELRTLTEVWNAYGVYDAKYLEELTHQEEPWVIARRGVRDSVVSTNTISEDAMKAYYSQLQH